MMWARGPAEIRRFDTGMVAFLHTLVSGGHPGADWTRAPHVSWTMRSDWLRRGLSVSAGPSATPE